MRDFLIFVRATEGSGEGCLGGTGNSRRRNRGYGRKRSDGMLAGRWLEVAGYRFGLLRRVFAAAKPTDAERRELCPQRLRPGRRQETHACFSPGTFRVRASSSERRYPMRGGIAGRIAGLFSMCWRHTEASASTPRKGRSSMRAADSGRSIISSGSLASAGMNSFTRFDSGGVPSPTGPLSVAVRRE